MNTISDKIIKRIQRKGRGWTFSTVDFQDLGTRKTVDQNLIRLVNGGEIRRVIRGIYDYPKISKFGEMPPNPFSVALALARSTGEDIQATESRAVNALGLSNQVPAKIIYYTNGTTRKRKVGNQVIIFKRAPKKVIGAGKMAGLVIQAIRYYGAKNINQSILSQIVEKVKTEDLMELKKEKTNVPVWLQESIDQLIAQA